MDLRVAVDLAGRGLEDARAQPLGEAQHVDRAVHRRLGRLDRVVLVVDRRRRAGEVVDLVDLDVERKRHVVADELEARMVVQVLDVALGAGEEIVDAEHLVALLQQPVAQMRAEESGAAGDQDALAGVVVAHSGPLRVSSGGFGPLGLVGAGRRRSGPRRVLLPPESYQHAIPVQVEHRIGDKAEQQRRRVVVERDGKRQAE